MGKAIVRFLGWLVIGAPPILIAGTAVLIVGIFIFFYWYNHVTIRQSDLVMIRRIAGWRTALCYKWDKYKGYRAFMRLVLWKDELTLERSAGERVNPHMPLWCIYHHDVFQDRETIISFFSNGIAEVRERKKTPYWVSFSLTKDNLLNSPRHAELVRRAEFLQKDLEKRIRPILRD